MHDDFVWFIITTVCLLGLHVGSAFVQLGFLIKKAEVGKMFFISKAEAEAEKLLALNYISSSAKLIVPSEMPETLLTIVICACSQHSSMQSLLSKLDIAELLNT